MNSAFSKNNSDSVCGDKKFLSSYFLVEASDVGAVSLFFQQLYENYFEEKTSYTGVVGRRKRVEKYFDVRDFPVLADEKELLLVTDENLPTYRVGRETVIFRDNGITPAKVRLFEVKRYNKKTTPLDKHLLFGRVKRKERPDLLKELSGIGQYPSDSFIENLHVNHEEVVYLVRHFGVPVAAVTLDKFHIANYGLPNTSTQIKFERFSGAESHLTVQELNELDDLFCNAINDFHKQFPGLRRLNWIGYKDYQQIANGLLPTRTYFRNNPLLFTLGQIVILSFIGFIILYLFIGRHSLRDNYRNQFTGNNQNNYDK